MWGPVFLSILTEIFTYECEGLERRCFLCLVMMMLLLLGRGDVCNEWIGEMSCGGRVWYETIRWL